MDNSTNSVDTAVDVSIKATEILHWPIHPNKKHSNGQLLWHLILLDLITFGLYFFYWSYRNWKHLKNYKNLDINPYMKALVLVIPIVWPFFAWNQFVAFRDFSKGAGARISFDPGWMTIAFIVFNAASHLPDPFWALSLLTVVPITLVQRSLNSAWAEIETGLPSRKLPTIGDLLAVIASWVIIVVVSMISTDIFSM